MATLIRKSALGTVSGKVGNVVHSKWINLETVRSTPKVYRKKKKESEVEIERKKKFAIAIKFLKRASEILKKGYQLKNNKESKTALNMATSHLMENAVVGEYPNYSIDCNQVKFSNAVRSTENGWNAGFSVQDNLFHVTWKLNPFREKTTQLDDKPVIIFFQSFENCFRELGKELKRSSLQFTTAVPSPEIGEEEEVFCWIFFTSADGKLVSETEYLGMFRFTA